jgi:Protein of unknown function (DUF3108)
VVTFRLTLRNLVARASVIVPLLVATLPGAADAQGRLEASYTANLGGMLVGTGALVVDLGTREYRASGNGRVDGLMQMLSTTQGVIAAEGHVNHDRLSPGLYQASVTANKFDYDVRMVLQSGNVKDLVAEPPLVPAPDRVPVTDTHRRGVLDPATAVLLPVAGNGNLLGSGACDRTLPIFDGHQRFNIVLRFRRVENVKAEVGYQGPAVVCNAAYQPVAGHRPGRYAIRYMQEQKNIEIWLAPIAGTRVLAPFRVSVPTMLGSLVIEARRFETVAISGPVRARSRPTLHSGADELSADRPQTEAAGNDETARLAVHPTTR